MSLRHILWITSAVILATCITQSLARHIDYECDYKHEPERDCTHRKLGYQVNIPHVPRSQKREPLYNYGYKIEKERLPTKTHMTYSFDFTVEEPKRPKPEKPERLNLYTKVDRGVKPKKYDYEKPTCACASQPTHEPPAHYRYVLENVTPCKCKPETCKCHKNKIEKVNEQTSEKVQHEYVPHNGVEEESKVPLKRNKRDVSSRRQSAHSERSFSTGRYLRKYQTKLEDVRDDETPLFPDFGSFAAAGESTSDEGLTAVENALKKLLSRRQEIQSTTSATVSRNKRRNRNKRDIKAEYDLIEKERAEMDLTLPEIVQYMPETMQPSFKRGQCHFNCQQAAKQEEVNQQTEEAKDEQSSQQQQQQDDSHSQQQQQQQQVAPNKLWSNDRYEVIREEPIHYYYYVKPQEDVVEQEEQPTGMYEQHNRIPQKRNALNYPEHRNDSSNQEYYEHDSMASLQPSANQYSSAYDKIYMAPYQKEEQYSYEYHSGAAPSHYNSYTPRQALTQSYYQQQQPAQAPCYTQQTPYYPQAPAHFTPSSAQYSLPAPAPVHYTPTTPALSSSLPYVFDGSKYLPNYGHLQAYMTGMPVPDPTYRDGVPLQYTGDLEAPPQYSYARSNPFVSSPYASQSPAVQHVSNEELDRVIQDIIYRHPDFIEATSHYGGALVDPEPQQKVQTLGFLKKLITGRLQRLFSGERKASSETQPDYSSAASTNFFYAPYVAPAPAPRYTYASPKYYYYY